MKKAIQFMKLKPLTVTISVCIIIGGFIGTIVQGGFNQGIDFVGGYNQQIQFAPVAFSITYNGEGQVNAVIQNQVLSLAILEPGRSENLKFNFNDYKTVDEFAAELKKINGINVNLVSGYSKAAVSRLMNTDYDVILKNSMVFNVNIKLESESEIFVNKDKLKNALSEFGRLSIQSVGNPLDQKFNIKIHNTDAKALIAKEADTAGNSVEDKSTEDTDTANTATPAAEDGLSKSDQDKIELKIRELIGKSFEKDATLFQKKDYIGSTFSKEIAQGSVLSVILAILLILVYVAFRFKVIYAIAAVLALAHDGAIMLGVIGTFQLEFNTTTIAALLTILGYSINDTIVVFDRVRENVNLIRDMDRESVINLSITQSLSRTLITALTTLLAVIAIYIVSTGVIKDFAFNMIIGITIGTYSSIYIASVLVLVWQNYSDKQKKLKQEIKITKIKTETPKTAKSKNEAAITTEDNNTTGEITTNSAGEIVQKKRRKKKKK